MRLVLRAVGAKAKSHDPPCKDVTVCRALAGGPCSGGRHRASPSTRRAIEAGGRGPLTRSRASGFPLTWVRPLSLPCSADTQSLDENASAGVRSRPVVVCSTHCGNAEADRSPAGAFALRIRPLVARIVLLGLRDRLTAALHATQQLE